jgi:hypothetical protein
VVPPVNAGNPPVNPVVPPVNVVIPPVNAVVPPVNAGNPPVNPVVPPVNAVAQPPIAPAPAVIDPNVLRGWLAQPLAQLAQNPNLRPIPPFPGGLVVPPLVNAVANANAQPPVVNANVVPVNVNPLQPVAPQVVPPVAAHDQAVAELQTALAGSSAAYHQAEARCREATTAALKMQEQNVKLHAVYMETRTALVGIWNAYFDAVDRNPARVVKTSQRAPGATMSEREQQTNSFNQTYPIHEAYRAGGQERKDLQEQEALRQQQSRTQQAALQLALTQAADPSQRTLAELRVALGGITDAYQNAEYRCTQANVVLTSNREKNAFLTARLAEVNAQLAHVSREYNKAEAFAAAQNKLKVAHK